VGAQLLAYAPENIALVRHAFDRFRWPIANVPSSGVRLIGDLGTGAPKTLLDPIRRPVSHPVGWQDAGADPLPGQSGADEPQSGMAAASVEPQDA
jgi:hypothetical protein